MTVMITAVSRIHSTIQASSSGMPSTSGVTRLKKATPTRIPRKGRTASHLTKDMTRPKRDAARRSCYTGSKGNAGRNRRLHGQSEANLAPGDGRTVIHGSGGPPHDPPPRRTTSGEPRGGALLIDAGAL